MKRRIVATLLAVLMVMVFAGWAPAPADAKIIEVATVDQLVAAIGPNATVVLQPGEYELAAAATYGQDTGNPYCCWEAASEDGFELRISNANGLALLGSGRDVTTLLAEDRYANVLSFMGCQEVSVSSLTAGHSPAPGYCSGGVLYFVGCDTVLVEGCDLFGCGTMGVWAQNCSDVSIALSRIYECSDSAVYADGCRNVLVLDSEIDHNGWKNEYPATCLFQSYGGDGFAVSSCNIPDNHACSFNAPTPATPASCPTRWRTTPCKRPLCSTSCPPRWTAAPSTATTWVPGTGMSMEKPSSTPGIWRAGSCLRRILKPWRSGTSSWTR